MKFLFTLFALTALVTMAAAQWSDTTNHFYDSLHMRITDSLAQPGRIEVVKSKPDGDYIVIWQENRGSTDIYAQKISVTGERLWQAGGIPVANGPTNQYMPYELNDFDRDMTYACTDGAGGLYVCWPEEFFDGTDNHSRIRVQHVRSDGQRVFAPAGYIVADYSSSQDYYKPQIVSDDHGGFYVGYFRGYDRVAIIVRCFKDENGVMKEFGGGNVSNFVKPVTVAGICGPQQSLDSSATWPTSFRIYPDLQGGCNVVISAYRYETGETKMATHYNRLVRVKKNSLVTVTRRVNDPVTPATYTITYPKDSVVVLYSTKTYTVTNHCTVPGETSVFLENGGQGVLVIDEPTSSQSHANGVMVPGTGNINFNVIGWNRKTTPFGTVPTGISTLVAYQPSEIYDSLPYQLCSDTDHPYFGYRPVPPDGVVLDTLNNNIDTLFRQTALNDYFFTMQPAGKRIIATARIADVSPILGSIYLQELNVQQDSPNRYSVARTTSQPGGMLISRERGGLTWQDADTSLIYVGVYVRSDSIGNAVLCMEERFRYTRVSPIDAGGKLRWGATGRPLGTGIVNDWIFQNGVTAMIVDHDGKGVVFFEDGREQEQYSNWNLYMRHLDSLDNPSSIPPLRKATLLQPGNSQAVPVYFAGSSAAWTPVETREYHGPHIGPSGSTPVLELFDNRALGEVSILNYQHTGPVRRHEAKPYLSRNWMISVQHQPNPGDSVDLRLIFTNAEFDSLRSADPSVINPGNLEVVKQPEQSGLVPSVYAPVSGEVHVPVRAWGLIDSGYYVQVRVAGFSNFFVRRDSLSVLPVNWLDVNARRLSPDEVRVDWEVSQEENVSHYIVQSSPDGRIFVNQCVVNANNSQDPSRYSCVVPAGNDGKHYFRVLQVDRDEQRSFSNTVLLEAVNAHENIFIGPNPTTSVVYLKYTAGANLTNVSLFNSNGILVWQSPKSIPIEGSITIPMGTLATGIYLLEVSGKNGRRTFRISKR